MTRRPIRHWLLQSFLLSFVGCHPIAPETFSAAERTRRIEPLVVTEPVLFDSDDPAIWFNRADPARSLVLGTCKHTENGGLYVFNLDGKILRDKTVLGLKRPNNVDLAYGFSFGGRTVDVAVVTERNAGRLRVFAVPEMKAIDGGGLPVFDSDPERLPMGVALYTRPRDGALFAIVSGRVGPREGYLWQYRMIDDGGVVRATKVRAFGKFSGAKEIESVAVDGEAGFVYYSDEGQGVRQYRADPDAPDAGRELAFFAREGFAGDHEGISVYRTDVRRGFVIVSNQDGNTFRLYRREGEPADPYAHRFVKEVALSTQSSDGSDVTAEALSPRFPGGLFVAMSTDRTFHFYSWKQLIDAP